MGIFDFLTRQLLSVIEWKDDSTNTMVWRFPLKKREEIMTTSTLVVRESQVAIFVHKGVIQDVFMPGTHKLITQNIPFLTKALSLPTGFESPIKAEVFFVNTKQFVGNKWGTQNPIMMRDAEFGSVRLRGFGNFAFRVGDAAKFMKEIFGTNNEYKVETIIPQTTSMLIQALTDAIAESKISALDLAANYDEFSQTVIGVGKPEFEKYGLELCSVVIENISLPEEVEKMLDERTKIGIMGNHMGSYTQMQAAQAMRDAASNPNGSNMAAMGVGFGAGNVIGNQFAQATNTAADKPVEEQRVCDGCGAKIRKNAKFCPECGKVQGLKCPKCGKVLQKNAKFCPECGESLVKKCQKCGHELKPNAKFCPECGEKA